MLFAFAKGGLGELRVYPVCISSAAAASAIAAGGRRRVLLLQPRHFVSSSAVRNAAGAADAGAPSPEAAAAAKAAKKTGRAFYWFVGVAAAAVIGSLAYPLVITIPPTTPPPSTPHPAAPQQTQKSSTTGAGSPLLHPSPAAPTSLPPAAIPGLISVPPLSPRDELTRRVETLKAELEELRKQKRSQLVDMKKRAIKDEIAMIVSGLKKLEKS